MTAAEPTWSVVIRLEEVGETGRHVELEASEATRAALAKPAGVDAVEHVVAHFDLARRGRDGLHVAGNVRATVRQSCVVTLEPLLNEIEEAIDVEFVPTREADADVEEVEVELTQAAEEREPLLGGVVDLGVLATEYLVLGVDPYPRKEGATFEPPQPASDPASHPFAGLAALQKKSTVKE